MNTANALSALLSKSSIVPFLMTLITVYLLPYLKQKAAESGSAKQKSDLEWSGQVRDVAINYITCLCTNLATKRMPIVAKEVLDGKMNTSFDVKTELYAWGAEAKLLAVKYFDNQGIDLLDELGTEAVDHMIDTAARDASPMPGTDTASIILDKNIANALVQNGVHWLRANAEKYEKSLQPAVLPAA